jgi:hypothetical protein
MLLLLLIIIILNINHIKFPDKILVHSKAYLLNYTNFKPRCIFLMPLLIFFSYKYKKSVRLIGVFEIFLSYRWNLKEKRNEIHTIHYYGSGSISFSATNLYSKMHL